VVSRVEARGEGVLPYLREIIPSDASNWRKRGSTRFIRIAIFSFYRKNRRDFPTSSRVVMTKRNGQTQLPHILTVKEIRSERHHSSQSAMDPSESADGSICTLSNGRSNGFDLPLPD
jgi:hypothetical protein